MIYRGRVADGVVILEGGVALPEGTPVRVETIETRKPSPAEVPLYRLGDLAVSTGVPDLALNIDHYLYGHPKVDDAQQ